MRHVLLSIAKASVKLFCILMAPVINLINAIYKIVVHILSYGLIGLILLCLLAIGAELFHYGITKEGVAYFVLATSSLVVRWALIHSVGIVEIASEIITAIANSSVEDEFDCSIR